MEEKDNQRFSESRLAEELSFRIYDNKRDIIVQLTDVERGWELKRKDSMQMRNSILGISIETSQLTSINPKWGFQLRYLCLNCKFQLLLGSGDNALVRALHLTAVACVRFLDLVSHLGRLCYWFSSLLRGFFSGPSGFLPPQKPTFQIKIRPGNSGKEEPPRKMSTAKLLVLLLVLLFRREHAKGLCCF